MTYWRCVRCRAAMALGRIARQIPPSCPMHGEMEQVSAAGFRATVFGPQNEE